MNKDERDEIELAGRYLCINGEEDPDPVPPFDSLQSNEKFKDYPDDTRLEALQKKMTSRGKLKIKWDRGAAIFGKDSGSDYDRIRVYFDKVLVFDPSFIKTGSWIEELFDWYDDVKEKEQKGI